MAGKMDAQTNERTATRFEGVYQRESRNKRYKGRPDVCYSIDYYEPLTHKRIRKTIGWRSEGVTAELAAETRRELLHNEKMKVILGDAYISRNPHAKELLFADAFEIYRRDWLEGRTKTLRTDVSLYTKHLSAIAPLSLSGITAHRLTILITELERKGLAPQTVHHAVALVRRVMRKMRQWKLWNGELPFDALTMPKVNNARTRYLTPDEAHALLDILAKRSPRMWFMSLISLHCGLRFGEIASLTFGDVDYETQSLHIRQSKSGKARQAVMSEAVIHALQTLPQGYPDDLLFPARSGGVMQAPSDTFEDCVNELGLNHSGKVDAAGRPIPIADKKQRVVFHTLRHTYASWLAISGQGQSMIADLLGHSSLEMSRRYTHLMPDARKATAKAIDAIFLHGTSPQ